MTVKLIVGLANPGDQYTATRHNAGAWYVTSLAKQYGSILKKTKKVYGYTGYITLDKQSIYLLIPNIFMNLSGKAVEATAAFYSVTSSQILVAHDELNLLPGRVRLKFGGNHGGHNGLKNILTRLGNDKPFYRLRIGVGGPHDKEKAARFVLSKPAINEFKMICNAINEAVYCTEILVKKGIMHTMNRLHSYKAT